MDGYQTLRMTVHDRVATVELNRPDSANALDDVMAGELADAAARCDTDPDVRAVVLTATGRFFCAGGDLASMAAHEDRARYVKGLADTLHRAISSFARMEGVLVVAVNGQAAGAGFSLAILGDLVVAAESARFTMAYTRAGLTPDGSSTYYLPRLVGLRRAQELILTNRTLSSAEALDWGLVTEVVPDDQVRDRAMGLATSLARGSVGAHGGVRQLLLSTYARSLEEQMELESRSIAARAGSPDGRAGVDAFLAKRTPEFG